MAIDLLIAYIVLSIAVNVIVPGWAGDDASSRQTATAALIVLGVLTVWFNYFVVAEWRWGQTLGKRALRITVADDSGGTLSWNRAVVRNLLLVVDVVAGLVLIPLSARKQRLGDRLAHTVVLVEDRAASRGRAEPAPAAEPLPPPSPAAGAPPPPPPAPAASGKPSATWGPGRVGGGILTLLVATVVEVGIISVFDPDLDSLGARLITQALLAATLVAIAFAVGPRSGAASAPALGLKRPLSSPIGMAAAAYLAYIVIALVYSSLVHPHQEDVTRDLGFGHGAVGAIAAGILIVVAAPISEEIFFRGFIFGGFRSRLPFPVAAVISAVIFGLFHYTGPGSIGVVPQLAFLGFALAWLYEETGSIYPTIGVHAVNNALAFAILTS